MKIEKIGIVLLAFFAGIRLLMAEGIEVGQWRTHFAPSAIQKIVQRHDEVFAVISQELVYVDTRDNRILEMNKVGGLSGTELSTAAYSPLHDILLVGYTDGRLDFVYGNNDVFTVYDIADKEISGGKAVQHICISGRYAYLSMPFGVVVVDLQKQEIKETYFIGAENTFVQVNRIAVFQNRIYAATEQGLKYADLSLGNLNDYTAWKTDTLFGGGKVLYVAEVFDRLMVGNAQTIYVGDGLTGWKDFWRTEDEEDEITALEGCSRYMAIGVTRSSYNGRVDVLDENAQEVFSTQQYGFRKILSLLWNEDGSLWFGTENFEFRRFDIEKEQVQSYTLRGPAANTCFELSATGKGGVTMANGGFDEAFAPTATAFGGNFFHNGTWQAYTSSDLAAGGITGWVRSVTQVLEDPFEPNHLYFSTSLNGLVEKTPDNRWFLYNADNSPLQNNWATGTDCRVYGMDFDRSGNLWMINAWSSEALVCKERAGSWKSYDLRGVGNMVERPYRILVDYWNTKWVIFDDKELSVFKTDGNSIQALKVDLNEGNTLRTSNMFCFVEDQLGHVWIGTDRGVKVIDQHARMFDSPVGNTSSVHAKTIRVPKDGFLIELLNTDQVRAIAVDGANRKWLGTQGDGIYLVSADGMEEIHHFTAENSPLLSNNILDIAVDDNTGEVFIGTDRGLIGYRGTATVTEGNPKDEARAFPNPVRPGYQGFINVRGLPQNAIVKITDTRGVLIYQGQATGGQLSWDGYALNGKRPNSGVLFVFACAEDGSQKLACKIFYVR